MCVRCTSCVLVVCFIVLSGGHLVGQGEVAVCVMCASEVCLLGVYVRVRCVCVRCVCSVSVRCAHLVGQGELASCVLGVCVCVCLCVFVCVTW